MYYACSKQSMQWKNCFGIMLSWICINIQEWIQWIHVISHHPVYYSLLKKQLSQSKGAIGKNVMKGHVWAGLNESSEVW